MKTTPAILVLAAALASCAPTTQTAAPTLVTRTASYITGQLRAGEDNPVLAAIVALAPTAPIQRNRQPWRAEEITSNSVVLRSNATTINTTTFGSFLGTLPQEMSWNVISASGITTVTATYSSAYAASAQSIIDGLDKRFKRVK